MSIRAAALLSCNIRRFFVILPLAFSIGAVACTTATGPTLADGGAPPTADGGPEADAGQVPSDGGRGGDGDGGNGFSGCPNQDSSFCHDIVNTAELVGQVRIAENAPAARGGRWQDGLYHMTEFRVYTGPGGATGPNGKNEKHTVRLTGLTATGIGFRDSCSEQKSVMTMDVDGGDLFGHPTCPPGQTSSLNAHYTVLDGGTQMLVFRPDGVVELLVRAGP